MRILIMGLPGSGKTTLAKELEIKLGYDSCVWFNADAVRNLYNDWDFSLEGRIRQASRMRKLSEETQKPYVICDFVAPLQEMRDIFDADYVIWMDTISMGRFEDTNAIFEKPTNYDIKFNSFPTTADIESVVAAIYRTINSSSN